MMKEQVNRSGHDRECGQGLGKKIAAHLAREFSSQPNSRAGGERRKQTQPVKRFSKQMPRDPGEEGNQRRLVHVTEVQMFGAGEIVQLVAKDSVAACR